MPAPTRSRTVPKREQTIARWLRDALRAIENELDAAGDDEVVQHPTLAAKRQLVDRSRRWLATWEAASPAALRVPPRVGRGLLTLATHAAAGGPDDLEIDTTTAEGRARYRDVERAIAWVHAHAAALTGGR